MATREEIEILIAGRALIDSYRAVKTDTSVTSANRATACTTAKVDLEGGLSRLGFASIDEFFQYDGRLSMLELVRCYKTVHSKTGEENPLCDLCIGREPPGCLIHPVTGEVDSVRSDCVSKRISTGERPSLDFIKEDEDLVLVLQKKRAEEEKQFGIPLFSICDAIFMWNLNANHVSNMKCVAKAEQVFKTDFDPFWYLGKFSMRA